MQNLVPSLNGYVSSIVMMIFVEASVRPSWPCLNEELLLLIARLNISLYKSLNISRSTFMDSSINILMCSRAFQFFTRNPPETFRLHDISLVKWDCRMTKCSVFMMKVSRSTSLLVSFNETQNISNRKILSNLKNDLRKCFSIIKYTTKCWIG